MGASRYIAISKTQGHEPGDYVTGARFEQLGEPDGFWPADFPEDVTAAEAEIAKAAKTTSKTSKAKDNG